jgi:hypothetical protein
MITLLVPVLVVALVFVFFLPFTSTISHHDVMKVVGA